MRKSGPPKGLVSYLVLELLDEQPRYGYEILKEIEDLSGGHWEPSYGSVYPILYKFEDEGYAERIEVEDEPDRKYFEITEAGREELAEKRAEVGDTAKDVTDVILGFYHVFAVLATDDASRWTTPRRGRGGASTRRSRRGSRNSSSATTSTTSRSSSASRTRPRSSLSGWASRTSPGAAARRT
nr:PadR family transcriptional regulator [Halobacterium sp. CBA1126]